jgi:hypothetical protein
LNPTIEWKLMRNCGPSYQEIPCGDSGSGCIMRVARKESTETNFKEFTSK